jgi:hypothetical protein
LLLALSLLITGCGDSTTAPDHAPHLAEITKLKPEQASKAEAACRQSVRETTALARRLAQALAEDPGVDAIGSQLVEPGIDILERESTRLKAIPMASDSSQFSLYVGLFEPMIELAEQRLEAGRSGEPERGQALERLIAGLGDTQVSIAAELGLDACRISFTKALGGRP